MPTYFTNYIDFMKIFEPILFKQTFKHLGRQDAIGKKWNQWLNFIKLGLLLIQF
jgi:hypothetical protein